MCFCQNHSVSTYLYWWSASGSTVSSACLSSAISVRAGSASVEVSVRSVWDVCVSGHDTLYKVWSGTCDTWVRGGSARRRWFLETSCACPTSSRTKLRGAHVRGERLERDCQQPETDSDPHCGSVDLVSGSSTTPSCWLHPTRRVFPWWHCLMNSHTGKNFHWSLLLSQSAPSPLRSPLETHCVLRELCLF